MLRKFHLVIALLICFLAVGRSAGQKSYVLGGRFDRTFGENGLMIAGRALTAPIGIISAHRLTDGKLLIVFNRFDGASGPTIWTTRHLSNGEIDLTYGTNGFSRVTKTEGLIGKIAEFEKSGKIIVAGGIFTDTRRNDMFVLRFDENGQVDESFGQNGLVQLDHSAGDAIGDEEITGLSLLSDGKIVVGGISSQRTEDNNNSTFIVLSRLLPTGKPDSSFGVEGHSKTFLTNGVGPGDLRMAIQNDKKILVGTAIVISVAGSPNDYESSTKVFRFRTDGSLDADFGKSGSQILWSDFNTTFRRIVQLPDGKILTLSGTFQFSRLNSNGSFDSFFGNGGKNFLYDFSAWDFQVLESGKILAVGVVGESESPFGNKRVGIVARYFSDGTPDVRFGYLSKTKVNIPKNSIEFFTLLFGVEPYFLAVGRIEDLNQSPILSKPVISRFYLGK